jgi:tetratricopeptide (TPR) repeat protein
MSLSQNKNALFGNKSSSTGSGAAKPATASATIPKPPTTAPTSTSSAIPPVSKTAGMTLKPVSSASSGQPTLSIEAKRKKMEEAREASEKGMECLKTGFFQWKPDHLSAATHFENSANLYRTVGEYKNAIAMMMKAAESNEQCGILSAAAINKTKSADIAKESGNVKLCVKYLKDAAETWGIHGDLQKYGETLMKAAKEVNSASSIFNE